MMQKSSAATVIATTHTLIQLKFSVRLAILKTKTQSLTRYGTATITIKLAKNATVSEKP
jgi:hypothetical protein